MDEEAQHTMTFWPVNRVLYATAISFFLLAFVSRAVQLLLFLGGGGRGGFKKKPPGLGTDWTREAILAPAFQQTRILLQYVAKPRCCVSCILMQRRWVSWSFVFFQV